MVRTSWALFLASVCLAMVGCGKSRPNYSGVAEIAALRAKPFCLYAIDAKDGHVWRLSLDGSVRELVLRVNAIQDGKRNPHIRLVGGEPAFGTGLPSPSVSVTGAIQGQGLVRLQSWFFATPKWESMGNRPRRPPSNEAERRTWQEAERRSPWLIQSPWHVKYKVEDVTYEGDTISRLAEATLTHEDGTVRSHRFAADPMVLTTILGIFDSRYVLVFDNPQLILWDLRTNVKRLLIEAVEVAITMVDANARQPIVLMASVSIDGQPNEWPLKGPDDLAPRRSASKRQYVQ